MCAVCSRGWILSSVVAGRVSACWPNGASSNPLGPSAADRIAAARIAICSGMWTWLTLSLLCTVDLASDLLFAVEIHDLQSGCVHGSPRGLTINFDNGTDTCSNLNLSAGGACPEADENMAAYCGYTSVCGYDDLTGTCYVNTQVGALASQLDVLPLWVPVRARGLYKLFAQPECKCRRSFQQKLTLLPALDNSASRCAPRCRNSGKAAWRIRAPRGSPRPSAL